MSSRRRPRTSLNDVSIDSKPAAARRIVTRSSTAFDTRSTATPSLGVDRETISAVDARPAAYVTGAPAGARRVACSGPP
jgi:hypothetical protein